MSQINWRKEGEAQVADVGDIGSVEVVLEFEQTKAKGMLGGLRNKFQPADPDLVAIVFAGSMAVEAADPKNRHTAAGGCVQHTGDAAGSGSESVILRLGEFKTEDADLTGVALVAACSDGFSRVEGAKARIYDTTGGIRDLLTTVRFDLLGSHTGALLATVKRTESGWQFRREAVYGSGSDWRSYARMATGRI